MADEEAGVHADAAVERGRGTRRSVSHFQSTPVLERGERHALDLGHHAAQVVGVAGVQRREREAAVAADHAS